MRHLNPISDDASNFIDDIIKSKRSRGNDQQILEKREKTDNKDELTYKERCSMIKNKNIDDIEKYDIEFEKDTLDNNSKGVPNIVKSLDEDKQDFLGLYKYESSPITKLRNKVLKTGEYSHDFCPICEVNKASTIDHYMPQTEYPLFVVHPRNLIPCCPMCNQHKSKNVFGKGNKRKYWNAYIDIPPKDKFLYCKIIEEYNMPKANFYIEKGNLSDDDFVIISNTINDLQLLEMYADGSGRIINDLKNKVCNMMKKGTNKGDLNKCINTCKDNIVPEDINEWTDILRMSLLESDIFIKLIKKELDIK